MKYKVKQELQSKCGRLFTEGQIIDSKISSDFKNDEGVVAIVLFTDTRFFEPIKNITVQVEIPENMFDELKEWVQNIGGKVEEPEPEYYTDLMNYLFANNEEAYQYYNEKYEKVKD